MIADLDTALQAAGAHGLVVLLIIDVRDFRQLNRSFGMECGDDILRAINQRLHQLEVGAEDFHYHYLGSDEFAIVLPHIKSPGFAVLFAERLIKLFKEVFEWQEHTLKITINCGIAYNYENHGDVEKLVFDAEVALEEAKNNNQPYLMLGKDEQQASDQLKWELLNELHDAMEQQELVLYYQPKLSLKDNTAKTAEALIRWPSAERGLLSPDITIPLIEHLGSEFDLIKWLLNNSMKHLGQASSDQQYGISINIPASSITSKELYTVVAEALNIWSVPPNSLTLEITEDVLIDDKELAFDYLQKLRDTGVRVSIDDFGTGYSSLAYFKHIPADELKIDQYFINNIGKNESDRTIVKLIIELAHAFNLEVVAEGVEDEATMALLKSMNCDYVQGYLISRPLPYDEYREWLLAH